MRRRAVCLVTLAGLMALGALPAAAWGPKTQVAIVTTASRVLSHEANIPLTNLEGDIRAGASASADEVKRLAPSADSNLAVAIESEMYLLQAVYGDRVDPYFAYRLGVLGKLVAQETAPLAKARGPYPNQYYADVERNIGQAELTSVKRAIVAPAAYFERVRREASARDDLITKDYQSGLGFGGVARSSLSDDASRSVNAVADVWYTILRESVAVANRSPNEVREYVVEALDFYIKRGNQAEVESAYQRLGRLGVETPDLRKRIGDMFYDARQFDRAMQEYRAVLVEEPGRRDVIERMGDYFVRRGDEALEIKDLEAARDAYAMAVATDALNAAAAQKRLQAEAEIAARDARLDDARQAIAKAQDIEGQADRNAVQHQYGQAIESLRQAREDYQSVTTEFPDEAREASIALTRLDERLRQVKQEMFDNAKGLSGSGTESELRRLALESSTKLDEKALRDLVVQERTKAFEELRTQLRSQAGASAGVKP